MNATVFVGTSLDGFIARPNGAFDFLHGGEGAGEPHGYEEFFATVDVLVMGRNTYDVVRAFDKWPYGKRPVTVLSTRPLEPAQPGVEVERMEGDPAAIVATLEARGVKHAYVDGGVTVQRFLRAGLINRIIVTRVPVLIGEGIPLFGPVPRDIRLTHVRTREYQGGAVQSEYAVVS